MTNSGHMLQLMKGCIHRFVVAIEPFYVAKILVDLVNYPASTTSTFLVVIRGELIKHENLIAN